MLHRWFLDLNALTLAHLPKIAAAFAAALLALDDTHVYLTLSNTGNVVRVPKLGGPAETIATGQASPYGVAVNDAGVCWANNDNGTVMRCPFP